MSSGVWCNAQSPPLNHLQVIPTEIGKLVLPSSIPDVKVAGQIALPELSVRAPWRSVMENVTFVGGAPFIVPLN